MKVEVDLKWIGHECEGKVMDSLPGKLTYDFPDSSRWHTVQKFWEFASMVNSEPEIHSKRILVLRIENSLIILRPSVRGEHDSEVLKVVHENLTGDLDCHRNLSRD